MSLSVVIVTYRSDRCIEGALASVRSQLPEAEIVVVDNASDDETRTVVRDFGGVRLVEQEENVGFGRACNTGARHASGTRVLFVNPDVRIVSAEPAELARSGPNGFGLLGGYLAEDPGSVPEDSLRGERHWLHEYVGQTFGLLRPRGMAPRPELGRERAVPGSRARSYWSTRRSFWASVASTPGSSSTTRTRSSRLAIGRPTYRSGRALPSSRRTR